MNKVLIVKLLKNKANKQFSLALPKKKIELLNEKSERKPKQMKIKDWEWIFE